MKKYILYFMLVGVILFQVGCSKDNSVDWDEVIKQDFFSGESNIEKVIAEKVSIKTKQKGDELKVYVTAPNICDDLIEWMNMISDEEFTESAMELEILQLLEETERTEYTYSLKCSVEDDYPQILYTPEFTDTVSCGLKRFYAEVTQQIINELEVEK